MFCSIALVLGSFTETDIDRTQLDGSSAFQRDISHNLLYLQGSMGKSSASFEVCFILNASFFSSLLQDSCTECGLSRLRASLHAPQSIVVPSYNSSLFTDVTRESVPSRALPVPLGSLSSAPCQAVRAHNFKARSQMARLGRVFWGAKP